MGKSRLQDQLISMTTATLAGAHEPKPLLINRGFLKNQLHRVKIEC